jgi:hypothetical protein
MDTADRSPRPTGLNLCAAERRVLPGRNGFAAAVAGGDFSSNSPADTDAKANMKR